MMEEKGLEFRFGERGGVTVLKIVGLGELCELDWHGESTCERGDF